MPEVKRFSLFKPTSQTPFHIDFEWWKHQEKSWRVYLYSYLCPEHQTAFSNAAETIWIDYVDPQTAEVSRLDGLQHVLMTHCARQADFVTSHTSLVDAVFRILLTNGNSPMTPDELSRMVDRTPDTILRTLYGSSVYKGIRPLQS